MVLIFNLDFDLVMIFVTFINVVLQMVETQMVKGTVAPLTVSAQYLSATTIVKPVVVVSAAGAAPPHAPPS